MKISSRDEHIGPCSLFTMVLMHAHFKVASRVVIYIAMLMCILFSNSLNEVMEIIGLFCGISIVFLHQGRGF